MDKIKRFLECTVPVTSCNLDCSYCYIKQENRRNKRLPFSNIDPVTIGQALSTERLGGICYISLCGAGETLMWKHITTLTNELLKIGRASCRERV